MNMIVDRTQPSPPLVARDSEWMLQDRFEGHSFFDGWSFLDRPDPTNGYVNYLSAADAWSRGNVYVEQGTNEAVLRVNHWSDLPPNTHRDSIRLHSHKTYNSGLFILDVSHVPTGCSTWPAFWMNGPDPWPLNGEVDIMESVNGNTKNQMTLHTGEGCYLTSPGVYSGTALNNNCISGAGDNSGCGIISDAIDTVGPGFNENQGGAYILKFDSTGIQIWTFQRSQIPPDVWTSTPNPRGWRIPDAAFSSTGCEPAKHFNNMTMIFDITLCGDWAGDDRVWGNSGCPGTCRDTVMTGSNYRDAYFSIRSLRTFSSTSTGNWKDPSAFRANETLQPGSGATRGVGVDVGFGLVWSFVLLGVACRRLFV